MSLPAFIVQKLAEKTQDPKEIVRVVNNLGDNLNDIFQYNKSKVQLDSVLLQGVSLSAGTNNIQHSLNRSLTGWSLTRLRGPAVIYDTQDTNNNKKIYLQLVSDVAVVVDILVF